MKGPSYHCAEGLGTTGRTITKRRTEQAGVPSTDVRAYTLIAGPGAGPECGHRNRAAGTPATARGLERERYRNAFGGCSRNRSCAARIGRKLPSIQGVAEAVPAIASSFTTNIANRRFQCVADDRLRRGDSDTHPWRYMAETTAEHR